MVVISSFNNGRNAYGNNRYNTPATSNNPRDVPYSPIASGFEGTINGLGKIKLTLMSTGVIFCLCN